MIVNSDNPCIKLLQLLGCDLTAIDETTTHMQFGIICLEFIFAVVMIYLLWKMLYNAMIRFFSPKAW